MKSYTDLAIKRHDIDADHFQNVYSKKDEKLSRREKVFLYGRRQVLKELESILKHLPPGSRVLDVGCGTAHLTNWIKEKGFEVYGVEPAVEMYNYAVKNFPDIEIKKGIATAIPYEDALFDLVVAFEVLRYLGRDENEKAYAEMYRVLAPGGRVFVTQVNKYAADGYFFFYQAKEAYSKLAKKIHHYCNFTTPESQEKILKQTGFKSVDTTGVFAGSIRFAYKFGKPIGDAYSKMYEKIFSNQRKKGNTKKYSAHLIVTGIK